MLSNASGLREFFRCWAEGLLLTAPDSGRRGSASACPKTAGGKRTWITAKSSFRKFFSRHLGDNTVSQEGMNAFLERMAEFKRLCRAVISSQETADTLEKNMEELSPSAVWLWRRN